MAVDTNGKWISVVSLALLLLPVAIYIFSALCTRLSVPFVSNLDRDILQLVSQQWGLIHYSIVPSSSTDHHCGAVFSVTTSLPLLPVFVLLSCKLFLIFLFFRPAFASLGTLCNNPQQKTAKRIILCPCNLP